MPAEQLLEDIGRYRGAVRSGAKVDLQKAAEIVLNDFRSSILGRMTLETPEQVGQWVSEGQADHDRRVAERTAQREERARQRRKARK